ncbi:unnamed protein product, partial [Gulo gulo]
VGSRPHQHQASKSYNERSSGVRWWEKGIISPTQQLRNEELPGNQHNGSFARA